MCLCCVSVRMFCVCVSLCVYVCVLTGKAVKGETDKTHKVEASKSDSAEVQKKATVDVQKAVKVTPVKAVRSKRRVKGEGKPAHVLSSCCGIY